jgi:hypothetical protein
MMINVQRIEPGTVVILSLRMFMSGLSFNFRSKRVFRLYLFSYSSYSSSTNALQIC